MTSSINMRVSVQVLLFTTGFLVLGLTFHNFSLYMKEYTVFNTAVRSAHVVNIDHEHTDKGFEIVVVAPDVAIAGNITRLWGLYDYLTILQS